MRSVRVGDNVLVTTSDGRELPKVAVSGPVDGANFRVVWVCKPEDWPMDTSELSIEKAMAWPVESVRLP